MVEILRQYNAEQPKAPNPNSFAHDEESLQQQIFNDSKDPCTGLHPAFDPFKTPSQQVARHLTTAISNPISMLGISSPIFFNPQQQACLRSLVAEAGLHGSLSYHQTSSSLATAAANRIGMCSCPSSGQFCAEEPFDADLMVLSVDYTEVALIVLLYMSPSREEWSHGGVFFAAESTTDQAKVDSIFWRNVTNTLKAMLAETTRNKIDRIILSGTLVNNRNLHHAVLSSLGEAGYALPVPIRTVFERLPSMQLETVDLPMADPEIAAGQGVADLAWRHTVRGCMHLCTQRQRLGLPLCFWYPEPGSAPFLSMKTDSFG